VCKRLVDRANENGGPDNITVIAARFDGDGLEVAGQADEVGHAVFPLPDTGQHAALTPPVTESDDPEPNGAAEPLAIGSTPADEALPPESFEPFESFTVPESAAGGGTEGAEGPPASAPAVTEERRARGMAIAIALLAVLVAGAAWYVWETAREVVPRTRDTLAPSTPANSAPSTPPMAAPSPRS
jgi:hypothetical protein